MVDPMNNFLKSRGAGKNGEIYVMGELDKCGIYCELVTGQNLDYDIMGKYANFIFFVEVKNDQKATFTGNIAIEFYNSKRGRESGISSTKSDYWAHIVQNKIYLIRTEDLRQLITKTAPLKIIEGGDNNSALYLYGKGLLEHPLFFLHNKDDRKATLNYILDGLKEKNK